MLKREDNERLTRVGPGMPGGELFRRYWQPALLSVELPEPDGPPLRVRLLGEDLIAFRDSAGAVGLVDALCPHRRAPMFFGRNEECGLRCVYHGWKFDRDGACVDMPSEPPDSLFRTKVRIGAYPTHEAGGVIWTYMGPPDQQPSYPDYEWMRVPPRFSRVSKTWENCNWLQALEGGMDTAHSSFAHNEKLGSMDWIRNRDGAPTLDVTPTDYGYTYVSTRDLGKDGSYVRVYHFVMPAQQMRGGITSWIGLKRADVPRLDGHLWVPVDDEHTWVFNTLWMYDESMEISDDWYWADEARWGRGKDDLVPGTYQLRATLDNDYFIDRQKQKTQTFTGIRGINTQDYALQEGMGPIPDRSKEHLGTSDKAIITLRRLLLEGTRAVERGARPRGVDPATYRSVRAYDAVVPPGREWQVEFARDLVAKW